MNLIPNVLTPMSALDVLKAFRTAFCNEVGRTPSNSTLAILVAQSALECGRWKSMHCFNFGNIRPPKNWQGDYCQFRCNEQTAPGKWVWYDPPSPGSNFVAFKDAPSGAAFYMHMLASRWPEAWTAALSGNATAFVHGLKQRGYFTADEAPYLRAVTKLCAEFFDYMNRGLLNPPEDPPVPPHEPDYDEIRQLIVGAPADGAAPAGVTPESEAT